MYLAACSTIALSTLVSSQLPAGLRLSISAQQKPGSPLTSSVTKKLLLNHQPRCRGLEDWTMPPNISVREWIRWLPDPGNEPTSTLVLTSEQGRFVDIRILRSSQGSDIIASTNGVAPFFFTRSTPTRERALTAGYRRAAEFKIGLGICRHIGVQR